MHPVRRAPVRTATFLSAAVRSVIWLCVACRLGFTLPLLVFGGLEGLVAGLLLLPLPFSRPAIWLCKQSKSQIGRTVVYTIAAVLLVMLAAPLYDILHLHDRPEATAGVNIERR